MMMLGLAMLSLTIGSFLNVVIYRLPQMLTYETQLYCATLLKQPAPPPLKLNLCLPRSFCPSCKHQLSILSNIPLFSYMIQKGACRHCAGTIPIQYPLVEALTMLLSLLAAWRMGFNFSLVFTLGFIWIAIPLFVIDLKHQLLPDSLTLGLLWLGLIAHTQTLELSLSEAIWGAVIAYLFLLCFIQLFYLMTKKIGMGGGDVKLFAALGAWFGVAALPTILLFASISGLIGGGLYLKLTHQSRQTPIPFGPFLLMSGVYLLMK